MTEERVGPKVGDQMNVNIYQSPTRTTLFPEQFVVANRVDALQVMLLRMDPIPVIQEGVVKEVNLDAGTFEFEGTRTRVEGRLTDLGHFVVASDTARQLMKLLFKNLVENHAVHPDALLAELTAELSDAT